MDEAQMQNMFSMMRVGAQTTLPVVLVLVRRDHIVQDTIAQLSKQRTSDLKKPIKVVFVGEEAVDQGGVLKEFFLLLIQEVLNPIYGMFQEFEETRSLWFSEQTFEEEGMC
ncbi:PREDICTED: probable E3 ubiquitin-protein ligase HERC4 [Priapulus caudatus]|uniref:HECT-type E3 ubiquitin transferase n=1 Tax=Priapulus caudatus TaxID=37621 RepID=A0ABM1EYP2_PRICU|nr:PREDICTED: probable E3 ubiquitin-protein ligase HERC4 [Priapulus caudatus]